MKKVLSLLLCLCMLAGLAACGVKYTGIQVAQTVELNIGESYDLRANVFLDFGEAQLSDEARIKATEAANFTYASSDLGIVSVDEDGQLTAIAPGSAVVTVQDEDGIQAETTVTVREPVESIKAEKTVTLAVGETHRLSPKIQPESAQNETLAFVTSDSKVAVVDENGTISGVSAGECTITIRAENSVESTVSVAVTPRLESIAFEEQQVTVATGETLKLTVAATPEDAALDITWSVEDKKVATVDKNGVVTGKAEGTTKVQAVSGEVSAECEIHVVAASEGGTSRPLGSAPAPASSKPKNTNNTTGTDGNNGGNTGGNAGNDGGGQDNTTPQPPQQPQPPAPQPPAPVQLDANAAVAAAIAYANTLPYAYGVNQSMPSYHFGTDVAFYASQGGTQEGLNRDACQGVDMAYAAIMSDVEKLLANGTAPEDIPKYSIGVWFDGSSIYAGW